ncbi:uncharacterized protein AMSG_06936 [Thecamonas trahens ATCC 50062]|uniref:Uncharacterized protein n=1 Tax=Thecamonas trahens ATCC 50062 TaxID=461836 RepID=A0A0L0DDL4_THETB|nr:hypothetical protein AMSG_06936 [Thecamonas trahens ATCC 50062]KNC50437.1 hypothetical protein AMSG_06936 [Thecamonas trahens ATCC 50062]|eukprot:XP_013756976.1 hypothetical protein AMSG_06936 [Thecamonas trahens ATCC 50062]
MASVDERMAAFVAALGECVALVKDWQFAAADRAWAATLEVLASAVEAWTTCAEAYGAGCWREADSLRECWIRHLVMSAVALGAEPEELGAVEVNGLPLVDEEFG